MKINPAKGYLLVELEKPVTRTPSGLILPTDEGMLRLFNVIEIGAEISYNIGDQVILSRFAGVEIKMDNRLMFIVHGKDIVACINKDKE